MEASSRGGEAKSRGVNPWAVVHVLVGDGGISSWWVLTAAATCLTLIHRMHQVAHPRIQLYLLFHVFRTHHVAFHSIFTGEFYFAYVTVALVGVRNWTLLHILASTWGNARSWGMNPWVVKHVLVGGIGITLVGRVLTGNIACLTLGHRLHHVSHQGNLLPHMVSSPHVIIHSILTIEFNVTYVADSFIGVGNWNILGTTWGKASTMLPWQWPRT